jgi:hypothetical protein
MRTASITEGSKRKKIDQSIFTSINHRSQVSWKEITARRAKASHGCSRRKFKHGLQDPIKLRIFTTEADFIFDML